MTDSNEYISGPYGPVASPSMQRGRFAVIPEEPNVSGSPVTATEIDRRSPSPDWDFDDKTVSMDRVRGIIFC